jgi:hypothetical protein
MCFIKLLGLAWLAEKARLQCLHCAPGRFAVLLLARDMNSDRMGAGGRPPPFSWEAMWAVICCVCRLICGCDLWL